MTVDRSYLAPDESEWATTVTVPIRFDGTGRCEEVPTGRPIPESPCPRTSRRTVSVAGSLFQRVVVPVASRDDARATTAALAPYVDATGGRLVAIHVIEKAGGAPDKASVEQRECRADDIFTIVQEGLSTTDAGLETRTLYGTKVAETIVDAAHDVDASAIVFTPRGGSRWVKLLSGDVTTKLVNESDLPVLVLPDRPAETDT